MTSSVTSPSPDVFRRAGVTETVVLLALAGLVPLLVHLVPWSGARPLGVYLLPMFWTTFVAVYFYGGVTGLAIGLFAPAINLLVTGQPTGKFAAESTLELIVFAFVMAGAIRRWPRAVILAPLGYVVARVAWAEWLALTDSNVALDDVAMAGRTILRSLVNGLPGLLVLAGINIALVWFYAKPVGEKPAGPVT